MNKTDFRSKNIPEFPGVYFFLDKKHDSKSLPKKETILYIGKATILKDRIYSYFSSDLEKIRGIKLKSMIQNAKDIFYIKTDSVLEAIILESKYIKKFQPFFNTKEKDNKSYSYIIFTKEDFPKVLILREREIEKLNIQFLYKIGPFVSKSELVEIMKLIRKIFPYRDKCKLNEKRACFNFQLGLCPGTCINFINKKDYKKNILNIKNILEGGVYKLIKKLNEELKTLIKEKKFEEAIKIRDKLFLFKNIKDLHFIKNKNIDNEINSFRIESYDISHISGKNRVGVFVVFEDGEFNKKEYKKFKLIENKNNDLMGFSEILERRFKHKEWKYPDIIVIDGGKVHLEFIYKKLKTILNKEDLSKIKLFSVVKDERHKAKEVLKFDPVDKVDYNKTIILANEEAHRFAISYHRSLQNRL